MVGAGVYAHHMPYFLRRPCWLLVLVLVLVLVRHMLLLVLVRHMLRL